MRKVFVFVVTGLAGLAMTLGLTMTSGAVAQAATHRMQIYEIWYNSPGPDRGGNTSLNHEWVKLHNTSAASINLAHWTLRDKAGHVFVFGSYTIKPHGYVTIHTGHGSGTQTDQYWNHSWYIWNNTGDTAILRNQNGNTIASCTYKGTSQGFVYC
jgi:lamin tail-like protein